MSASQFARALRASVVFTCCLGVQPAGAQPAVPSAQNMFVAGVASINPTATVIMANIYWDDPVNHPNLYPSTGASGPFTRVPVPACQDGTNGFNRQCPNNSEPNRCADGTRPMVYYRAGANGNHHWLIRIQDGGASCEVNSGDHDVSALAHNCTAPSSTTAPSTSPSPAAPGSAQRSTERPSKPTWSTGSSRTCPRSASATTPGPA